MLHWFTFVVKWFVNGLHGPFGTVSNFSNPFVKAFFNNDAELLNLNRIPLPPFLYANQESLAFIQPKHDKVNCRICCVLFMINLVSSQVANSWLGPLQWNGSLPTNISFGSTFVKNRLLTVVDSITHIMLSRVCYSNQIMFLST